MFFKLSAFWSRKYFFEIPFWAFNAIYALAVLVLYNSIFFEKVRNIYPSMLFVSLAFVVLFLLLNAACSLLFFRLATKPLAIFFVFMNTAVFYFMDVYNAAIDKIMLLNVLETDIGEAKALLSFGMLPYLLFLGIFPAYLIYKTKIEFGSVRKEFWQKSLIIFGALLISAAIIFSGFKETAQFLRNNKSVKYYLVPVNYVGAAVSAIKIKLSQRPHELIKIAEDAKKIPYWKDNGKKNLFVFVVGETARSANFSLNGYHKPTNAPLDKYADELVSFQDVTSCGTSTAISLPCIFSKDERGDFKKSEVAYTENLLDVAQKSDYKVWWRGNVTGCKGLCKRVEAELLCQADTCYDEILHQGLKQRVLAENQDMFVVLHQLGSHGPTYYLRYPETAAVFSPVCGTERLDKCSQEEIMNVYDNTLYYTSQNLAQIIEDLKSVNDKYNTMLVYVSDHGESLGENNIYLHSAPYAIAPEEQKKVPLIVWMSESFQDGFGIDVSCLREKAANRYSHDNLFHSFLGIMGIQSEIYDEKSDIFRSCRKFAYSKIS